MNKSESRKTNCAACAKGTAAFSVNTKAAAVATLKELKRNALQHEANCVRIKVEASNLAAKVVADANEEAASILSQAQQEMKEWQNEKEMVSTTRTFDKKIKLDIGGNMFTSSLTTLSRFPDTMIGAMFSGRHSLACDEDRRFFIDRDGAHFKHILNFLRDPENFKVKLQPDQTNELKNEANYYGLGELMFAGENEVQCSEKRCDQLQHVPEETVRVASGYTAVVGRDENGLWYTRQSGTNSMPTKRAVRVCPYGAGNDIYTHFNGVSCIAKFTANRVVNYAMQPTCFAAQCLQCRGF